MKLRTLAAVYSTFVGLSMIALWTMLYITGSIPEVANEPIRIAMHITAEIATGVILMVGAVGLYQDRAWGYGVYLFSLGMLIYTLIQSPGYYAQSGDMGFVGMFAVFMVIALLFLFWAMVRREDLMGNDG